MRKTVGTLLGKSVAGVVRMRGKSSGQSMPGLVVEALIPGYLGVMLKQLPGGVVIITGTNGKTTTTKMVVELLRANHMRVLTNSTGSNLTRGIISSVSQQARRSGKLPYDLAVFELDEAYARQFTDVVKPRYVVGLNATRDQLDRFGEVDKIAELISDTMLSATEGIVTNADDTRLSTAVRTSAVPIAYFGVADKLIKYFPRDEELVAVHGTTQQPKPNDIKPAVVLEAFKGDDATYTIGSIKSETRLRVTGQHNLQNAAAALALVHVLLPDTEPTMLTRQLSKVKPAFGRGQIFKLKNGSTLQLNLVKNPASFRQGLASYVRPGTSIMIAINDKVADGRDMSWLWDVNFSDLHKCSIEMTTGTRAADMSLRLLYDDITTNNIEPRLDTALRHMCRLSDDKVIYASYTAMLHLHALLSRKSGKTL